MDAPRIESGQTQKGIAEGAFMRVDAPRIESGQTHTGSRPLGTLVWTPQELRVDKPMNCDPAPANGCGRPKNWSKIKSTLTEDNRCRVELAVTPRRRVHYANWDIFPP